MKDHYKDTKEGFAIVMHKGFRMTFANGWTISVQFGPGNYCENRYSSDEPSKSLMWQCEDAEIAAWDKHGNWYDFEYDQVKGRCSANDVAQFIAKISSKK